ncbi:MAG: energy-coupling factor transporter transmembrane protein EcfT [Firmicutes bacterium]|nr:energy-coupling factor transporter transmembrane protein EcfT [Bacillota bacterium]
MLGNITLGQFVPGDSLVHRLSPISKIIAMIISAASIMMFPDVTGLLITAGYILLVAVFTGRTVLFALRGLKPLWILLAFTFLFQSIAIPGETLFNLGFFDISKEGLQKAVFITGKLLFVVLLASIVTLTTSPIALNHGLERLLNPFKKVGLPVHELAMMITIALRFIPILITEADIIIKAQKSRGSDMTRGNPVDRVKALVPFIVPLLVGSLRRADELAVAMESRCYQGGVGRTTMHQMNMKVIDIAAVTVSLFYLTLAITLRLAGW